MLNMRWGRWLAGRVAVIYVIAGIFAATCMDLKTLSMRVKVRHLNDAIPDFSDLLIFNKDPQAAKDINWGPYQRYFGLVVRYMPDDAITRHMLGCVDYYMGLRQKAAELFQKSAVFQGRNLFWPNYNLGVVEYKKGDWSQAAAYLFKTISANPKLMLLLMDSSTVVHQMSANPYFRFSLIDDIKEAQSRSYILLLSALYHLGQFDKLVLAANLAVSDKDLDHQDAFYYYEGLGLLGLGHASRALACFQKSLNIEKGNPDVYYYLAGIFQKAGRLQEARQLMQVSYSLHQKNDPRFPYEEKTDVHFF